MQFSDEVITAGVFNQEMFDYYANPKEFDGTDLTVTEYPSPILRAENAEITEFDAKLQQLCKEFFLVMYGANGVGLAAPQVGLNLRLFVYNCEPTAPGALRRMGETIVCNPKIIEYCQPSGGAALPAWTDVDIEGCLSSRNECCRGDIRRASTLQVEYQDERGRVKKRKLRGFEARVFQHEYDHIQGVLHIDRQSPANRVIIKPFLDVLEEQHGAGGATEPLPSLAAVRSTLVPPPLEDGESDDQPQQRAASPPSPPKSAAKPKAKAPPKSVKSSSGFGGGAGNAADNKGGKKKKKR